MGEVIAWNPPALKIKSWIEEAGNTIGSVWFIKKSNNQLRKMCYRLHCRRPSSAATPCSHQDRKAIDTKHGNITLLDCNAVVRDVDGGIIGRGAWKSIPLNNVTRIKIKGKEINIIRE